MRAVREALDSGVEIASIAAIVQSTHLKKKGPFTFKMDDARKICTEWEKPISRFKSTPNVEIEWRLGRVGSRFDTNVGKESFEKVLKALCKYNEWEKAHKSKSTMYYFPGNKRVTVDDETDEQAACIKKRVAVDDFQLEGFPLDVRLGVSTEEPFEYDGEEESTEQRTKERWSFVRKNLSIDLSIVKGNPDDKDCDDDTTYQIELEIVDPKKVHTTIEIFNIIYKVFDIMKHV
jgi:hypothetical protein